MINNQQRVILNATETQNHQPVSAKPSVVSVSSIDSDVSDRRDVREALYAGIFRRHRKTILVLGSFLKMLRTYVREALCRFAKNPGKIYIYQTYLDRIHALWVKYSF
ncbi:uncharacterized protein LOC107273577 [Cephus cinctus]|uniref:Uncharacterized protein LOC107273577 n=1 Tax=Cephus cinctus TaxID=211228 RepID=A0AAJ7CDC4_CEPCN|nr:uncharacterized protein LOC107273577 [Cephus cinctus]XP_015607417.1 uncharacterized protein LOC107273577 [Cephus cinctus]XP_015607418.1 uncharacterized protein LOC107273577 [Cephus cinctus]XP_015607419.1 uncharacterized protein LOC107273577 [Cephus cinctus]XP_015607420.1 uncharacterized protein LOC107273577 [Cephus cinctus]XP_024946715.1 uncharacterized protein LOC107273577 [Cephus cinctus]XP_024946716.1 uncharacterized protein LOC107273577 [Cephus cinctus]